MERTLLPLWRIERIEHCYRSSRSLKFLVNFVYGIRSVRGEAAPEFP